MGLLVKLAQKIHFNFIILFYKDKDIDKLSEKNLKKLHLFYFFCVDY